MKKPEPLFVDGEHFEVKDYRDNPDICCAFVRYAHGNFTPAEVEDIRDWLTSFLDWYYQERDNK